ncbi:hypothetical protein QNH39_02185 [Neobacillus novalis]|uniref:Uncharacterized protein n=1 Tax=Neobacillus novalis TaxID=220687 RepID=A0AA95MRP9_9BACI|nr:hypothetical protein [Neobacillus novalis]WHY86710.1 hypothetical protein QNH39_02185 [Neobacillus novalis]
MKDYFISSAYIFLHIRVTVIKIYTLEEVDKKLKEMEKAAGEELKSYLPKNCVLHIRIVHIIKGIYCIVL